MESRQGCCPSFRRLLGLGTNEDREPQHGGNAVVVESGEEGRKPGLIQGDLAQGELDQGKLAQGKLARGKLAKKELAQVSPPLEVTGVVQEGEEEEEVGEEATEEGASASSASVYKIDQEEVPGKSDQEEPQGGAATAAENTRNPARAGSRGPHRRRPKFTLSQLQDLERLFHENRYPSLKTRKDLARWMGVSEADVQDWFRTRRSIFRRNNRLLMVCNMPPNPPNNAS
ncbi:rhox homeobox family member 2-like [Acomys russatus]|uniref:rhox homeobox family member 2-like n=1 Tax=Acomys russatus TaxID=60746 RepID=UPI0021E3238E|nr:rhox homeobox family member 2-like [Acomys russatus]